MASETVSISIRYTSASVPDSPNPPSGSISTVLRSPPLTSSTPAAAQIQPFIGQIVNGIHDAFSLAIAQSFWIGIIAAVIAAIAAATMQELALRQHTSAAAETAAKAAERGSQTPAHAPD